jgi:A/G-specific adenine glycosylase
VSKTRVIALQKWYATRARDLPWRRDGDLYSIWLSEIMLQQTQVATVIPYFLKFKARFPTVEDLAAATIDEVYSLWAGLGYYSRARNLHRGAQAIAARVQAGQGFPAGRQEWLEVPGVGPYTAGAICSIGLGQREPIVDGNVVRVMARLEALGEIDSKLSQVWALARAFVEVAEAEPRILNQALMELGATVCKPRQPLCGQCPVMKTCRGRVEWEKYPPRKPKPELRHVEEKRFVAVRVIRPEGRRGGGEPRLEVFLAQNAPGSQWREGLWDFPLAPPSVAKKASLALVGEFRSRYQVTIHKVQRDHQVLEVDASVRVSGGEWYAIDSLPGVPAPVKKALKQIQLQKGRVVVVTGASNSGQLALL